MRVLFLSTWFPYPPDNGSKIRVNYLLRALAADHDVTLLSFAFGTACPDSVAQYDVHLDKVASVRCDPFRRSSLARSLRYLSLSPIVDRPVVPMTALVSRIMGQSSFDAIIASTSTMAVYALMARGIPKVLEEHNSLSRWAWERYQGAATGLDRVRRWANWWKRRRYESHLYSQFDLCTMVSEQDRDVSLQLPGYVGRVEVVSNGVDCRRNQPGAAPRRPRTLIYNGALAYSANYDAMQYFLAEIYPRIRRQVPDVSMTITGSTEGVDLSGLSLGSSVRLRGYVEDVRPLVAGSAVCVVPIRQGGGTRLKVLEAMALGTPVVATSKGAEGLDVVGGEQLLLADEPETFAASTVALLRNPNLCQQLAASARCLVEENYDWEQIGQRFVSLVEGVVKSRRQKTARC